MVLVIVSIRYVSRLIGKLLDTKTTTIQLNTFNPLCIASYR